MSDKQISILMIDDNENDFTVVSRYLCELSPGRHHLDWAKSCQEARDSMERRKYDLMLVDYGVGQEHGLAFLQEPLFRNNHTPFILLSGDENREVDLAAMRLGASDYLLKNQLTSSLLERSIRYCLEHARNINALRQSELFAQSVLNSVSSSVAILDESGVLIAMNEIWKKSAHSNPFVPANIAPGFHYMDFCRALPGELLTVGCDIARITEEVREGTRPEAVFEYCLNLQDKKEWYVARITKFQAPTSGNVVVGHEKVTSLKEAQEELLKLRKLEALGLLAGGMSHDLNNILTILQGNVSLLSLKLPMADEEVHAIMSNLDAALFRARQHAQQFVTFSKGGNPILIPSSVVPILNQAFSIALKKKKFSWTCEAPESLWQIRGDPNQLAVVFQHLIANAQEAMAQGGTIVTSCENIVASSTHYSYWEADAPLVKISVMDKGVGIADENLQKIFDPFFTTKTTGRGLGLSLCHSIIQKHNGKIEVKSKPGEWTIVSVYLPAVQTSQNVPEKEKPSNTASSATGCILVMDDDDLVGRTAQKVLGHLGYGCEFVRDGVEAIRHYKERFLSANPFQAVILDIEVSKGMGGREAVQEILKINPHAKVLVSSGYCDDSSMENFRSLGFSGILPKPYSLSSLKEQLRLIHSENSSS